MKLPFVCAALVLSIFALSGCSQRHFAVCFRTPGQLSCSPQRFTEADAKAVGRLLAAQPLEEDLQLWVIDTRKHQDLKSTLPEPKQKPLEGDKL